MGLIKPPVIDKHDIRFDRLSISDESLQSRIKSIVQDNYGFLWFGTFDGLYRYDGYTLKAYRHERGDPNSVAGDTVLALYRIGMAVSGSASDMEGSTAWIPAGTH